MKFAWLIVVLCGAALILYHRYRLTRSRPSDYQAIERRMEARRVRAISVTRNDDYWRYWLQNGRTCISNCARIYVILGEDENGSRREIHVAFDDWMSSSGRLKTLEDRELPPGGGNLSR